MKIIACILMFLVGYVVGADPIILQPGESVTIEAASPAPPASQPTTEPTEPQPDPPPDPTLPPPPWSVVRIGPSHAKKSLDDVNLDIAGMTYLLERGAKIQINAPQRITKSGITIRSADGTGSPATIHFSGGQHARAIQVSGESFTLADVRIVGQNKAAIIRGDNPKNLSLSKVEQRKGADGQGISIAEIVGSENAVIDHCSSEYTGWNAIYFSGKSDNKNPIITNCKFGPSKDEHCFRAYGLYGAKIGNCTFDNSTNNLKQGWKIMSGDGIEMVGCTTLATAAPTKGTSVRCGRDPNDPPEQTLKNFVIDSCTFKRCTWFKIDAGSKVAIRNSTIESLSGNAAIDIAGDARLYMEDCSVTGPKVANNPGKVTMVRVKLNGVQL